jgi:hypothetical protein
VSFSEDVKSWELPWFVDNWKALRAILRVSRYKADYTNPCFTGFVPRKRKEIDSSCVRTSVSSPFF